jgi:hypothetical protein
MGFYSLSDYRHSVDIYILRQQWFKKTGHEDIDG